MTAAKIAIALLVATWLAAMVAHWLSLTAGKRMELPPNHWAQELARRAGLEDVAFYHRALPANARIAAYSIYMPGHQAVVFNPRFFFGTSYEQLAFITAHELGHLALGHCQRGFWRVALGYGLLLPRTKAAIARQEAEADAFAEQLTGIKRLVLE